MRIRDWSSDVCSSDLNKTIPVDRALCPQGSRHDRATRGAARQIRGDRRDSERPPAPPGARRCDRVWLRYVAARPAANRSEEHTSELQSLMRISYAVFCLNKKNKTNENLRRRKHRQK